MPLTQELEPPRARFERPVLIACTVAVVAFTVASITLTSRASGPAVIATPVLVPMPVLVPEPVEVVAAEPEPDPPQRIEVGTSELARFVGAWLSDPSAPAPAIEYRRGILYVKSADDRGDDPPYPRSADPDAQRVCGSAAVWLRDHLRARLAWAELSCTDDECTTGAMEYVPRGRLTFRRTAAGWTLDTWTQTYVAALGPEEVQDNLGFVKTSLAKLAHTSCPGEPAGSY